MVLPRTAMIFFTLFIPFQIGISNGVKEDSESKTAALIEEIIKDEKKEKFNYVDPQKKAIPMPEGGLSTSENETE